MAKDIKKKKRRSFVRRILRIFLLVFLFFFIVINFPIFILDNQQTSNDYSDWMDENLTADQLVIDIAMPGAHDALSSNIGLFSKVDNLSASSVMKGVTGVLIRGFAVSQSKTQISDIGTLLDNGIRYIDVRVTLDADGDYYTVHNFYSDRLDKDLEDIAAFLGNHDGEFLILDLQHIYGVDYSSQADFDAFYSTLQNSGILQYAYGTDNGKTLSQVTYGDVTDNKSHSGVIILSKFVHNNQYIWDYDSSIRSAWADMDSFDGVAAFLRNEKQLIDAGNALTGNQDAGAQNPIDSLEAFRVMQAVTTMQMSPKGIANGIITLSLINRAKNFNNYLLGLDDFDDLVKSMPIVMLDYADTNSNAFLDRLMTRIIDINDQN